jgi:hypothetical protein
VPDKFGNLQSFQVLIEQAPGGYGKHIQSRIWFEYETVASTDLTAIGIEDQQGGKGSSYDYHNVCNQKAIRYEQIGNSAFIDKIKISLSENDDSATTEIDTTANFIRGYNVILDQELPDENGYYAIALDGSASLLLTALDLAGLPVLGAGILMGTLFVCRDLSLEFSRQQQIARLLDFGQTFAEASTPMDEYYGSIVTDASFDITAYWIFSDSNNRNHELTITSQIWYYEYEIDGDLAAAPTLSTSTTLRTYVDDNNDRSTSTLVANGAFLDRLHIGGYDAVDWYSMTVSEGYTIRVIAQARQLWAGATKPDFLVSICDSTGFERKSTTHGYFHDLTYTADYSGQWYVKVQKHENCCFYNLRVMWTRGGGVPWPGGACPFLYVYDGVEYASEGLLDIHNSEGIDVVGSHILLSIPWRVGGTYMLRLVEHPQTHSHIDQVKLRAILGDGTTIQLPLIWAWHSENGFVLPQLFFSDDYKTEIWGANWNNGTSESIELSFLALPPWISATGFIFQIEGNNPVWKV